jgi:hypothetical protein
MLKIITQLIILLHYNSYYLSIGSASSKHSAGVRSPFDIAHCRAQLKQRFTVITIQEITHFITFVQKQFIDYVIDLPFYFTIISVYQCLHCWGTGLD